MSEPVPPPTPGLRGSKVAYVARGIACAALMAWVAGCKGVHSALDPAGPQAQRIDVLNKTYMGVCAVVFVLVVAVAIIATMKNRARGDGPAGVQADLPQTKDDPARMRRMTVTVSACVAATIVILFSLIVGDFATGRAIHRFSETSQNPVTITVTGHQWWWEVRYDDASAQHTFTDANEIHVPVGRPVRVWLQSSDVIHSFWVPNLHGKKDLVPGHPTAIYLQADRPGTYYGQCAEFCGLQHAKMRLVVHAVPQAEFDGWLASARSPASQPSTPSRVRGQQVFLSTTCIMCHTAVGTPAFGRLGPDLTHVGARESIAAGSLKNTPENLALWIRDPQHVKNGVRMPQHNFSEEDLKALADYLWNLK